MTVHDRIKLVVKWLIGTGLANNQEAIGRLMGYSNKSSFSQILNNKVPIPGDFIDRLCALNDNINKVWIQEERDSMLRANDTPTVSAMPAADVFSESTTRSDAVLLRLIDKLDEKDALLKEKEAQIDHLQSELLSAKEELAALKAKYPETSTAHPEGLGTSETALHVHSHPHSPTSEHYHGGSSQTHQERQ